MRKDFDKVVTERPRAKGWHRKTPKGENRNWQRYGEDCPKREKIRQKWLEGGKQFTDVISPLYRYLISKVGEKWDDVYSEICQNLPKKSLQGLHIHDHISSFVETHVIMIDGVPCDGSGGMSYGIPLRSHGSRYSDLYVHPETGILSRAPERKRYKWHKPTGVGIKVDETHQYHKIDDVWYEVELKHVENPYPYGAKYSYVSPSYYDVAYKCYRDYWRLSNVYGGTFISISKRQLNKREIRKLGL